MNSKTPVDLEERAWWPRAALRRDEDFDLERKVTWLELFFDLVFVVVLARMAHHLAHHVDTEGVIDFSIQFAAVFWAWNAFAFYIERFESGGLENRCFMFAAMAAVAAMAVWTTDGLGSHYSGFALAYLATRGVNMMQWIRAAAHVAQFRPVAVRFVGGFVVAASLIGFAGQLDSTARRLVVALAILVEVLTPIITLKHQFELPELSTSKFPERFGLFTIIVLGESVVGVITGLSELNEAGELGVSRAIAGLLGLGVGIGLWWLYFDFIARRAPRAAIGAALGWVYLHLVTLAAFTAVGASISVAISADLEGAVPSEVRRLLGASAGCSLIGLALLEMTLRRLDDEPTAKRLSPVLKAGAGASVAVLALLDLGWNATALLALVVAGCAVPAIYGVVVWYRPSNAHRHLA